MKKPKKRKKRAKKKKCRESETLQLEEWLPIYRRVIEDLGYSEEEDERAAELLADIRGTDTLSPLKELKGKIVDVQGPLVEEARGEVHIAAGAAVSSSNELGCDLDLMVTDLDGDIELQIRKNMEGVTAVIHAHGDNIDLIQREAKKFKGRVISTCQCEPPEDHSGSIYNFGGFTDGDRAAFIADHFGAEEIILSGWDFDEPSGKLFNKEVKRKKLRWAEKLIERISTPVTVI